MLEPHGGRYTYIRNNRPFTTLKYNREEIIGYIKQGLTGCQIEKIVGCSHALPYWIAKHHGLKMVEKEFY